MDDANKNGVLSQNPAAENRRDLPALAASDGEHDGPSSAFSGRSWAHLRRYGAAP